MIDLAYAMGPAAVSRAAAPRPCCIQLVPIALVLGIFFFLVIRPQQRERRQREQMLAGLKKGDRVVTAGGLHRHGRRRDGPARQPEAGRHRPRGVPPERDHGARVRRQGRRGHRPDGSGPCLATSGSASASWWPSSLASVLLVAPRDWRGQPRQPINLGLDLQGGIHLVLGVDLDKGIENVLDRMAGGPPVGAPAEGHRRPASPAKGARGDRGPARLPAGVPRAPSSVARRLHRVRRAVAGSRRRAGSSSR